MRLFWNEMRVRVASVLRAASVLPSFLPSFEKKDSLFLGSLFLPMGRIVSIPPPRLAGSSEAPGA